MKEVYHAARTELPRDRDAQKLALASTPSELGMTWEMRFLAS